MFPRKSCVGLYSWGLSLGFVCFLTLLLLTNQKQPYGGIEELHSSKWIYEGTFLWLRKSNRKQQTSTKPPCLLHHLRGKSRPNWFYLEAGMCWWRVPRTTMAAWWLCEKLLFRNVEVLCPISVILNWQETCSVDQGALFLCCVQVPLTRASALVFGVVSAVAAGSSWLMYHTRLLFIICLHWRPIYSGTSWTSYLFLSSVNPCSGQVLLYFLSYFSCIVSLMNRLSLIGNALYFTFYSLLILNLDFRSCFNVFS